MSSDYLKLLWGIPLGLTFLFWGHFDLAAAWVIVLGYMGWYIYQDDRNNSSQDE